MPVAELLQRHAAAWRAATGHPFLAGVRDGSVPVAAFDTWLVQDARFVADLLRFQARLLARAPRPAQAVLAAGIGSLVAELDWFEQQAGIRGLDLTAAALPATRAYAALLERLDRADVGTALMALWTIERTYLDAWTQARPGAPAYREFVEHWTESGFAGYVAGLEAAADAAGGGTADDVFLELVAAETAFWDMALRDMGIPGQGVPGEGVPGEGVPGHGDRGAPVTLSAVLWAENGDLAAAALAHPFVTGIADGTLPRERFAGYVAQDAFFLESFARGYALAAAHSTDRAGLDAFAGLLAGVREELRLHAGYAAREGIDLTGVQPLPATLAYTDFLLATASLGGTALTCAAMTPCMRLYAHLGQSLTPRAVPDGDYTEWVATYADPAFEALAGTLEELLDAAADVPAVHRAYRRAMELELGFFDAAWSGG